MSAKTVRAKWSIDSRAEAVRLLKGGQSIADVALGLGIPRSTLGSWLRQAHDEPAQGPTGTTAVVTADQLEIARLRAEIARLKKDCDAARQAARHFAQITNRVLSH
ncbi:hypothetical protein DIC66_16345 [Rhodoferax lacus]|uniref:Transposase n=1 Tax=Rhodoferax lacus TaxID=2184758 RepID=A0A3E1R8R6_9BURK|nr:hypothetical protein DIC66_16345 [Rhodoferax lacus]